MLRIKKDVSGVVNFVMVRTQETPGGWITTKRVDDAISRAKHGFKYKLITSDSMKQLLEEDGVTESSTNKYPSDFSSPFTTSWVASVNNSSNPVMTIGSTVTCNDESEYNKALWLECKARMADEGLSYMATKKYGKTAIEIEFPPGQVSWSLGGVVSATISEKGIVNKALRVISRELTSNGERYVLEEDEGSE